MEDIDREREVPGAAERILRTLEAFGLEWDGPVEYQSRRTDLYRAALDRLQAAGRVYPCNCSRARLARVVRGSDGEAVYPGTCRKQAPPDGEPCALRFRIAETQAPVTVQDGLQGRCTQDVAATVGDFVIRRRDGLFAYQLAVVVDDADQQVTQVVRGCDLLDNTPRQVLLQQALMLPTPEYLHLPLVVEPDGTKLAKKARSIPLDPERAPALLFQALSLLRQDPPDELRTADLASQWQWARQRWSEQPLQGVAFVHG
jgi:glutamyl-Q tRNA(Asp) synthetase